MTMAGIGLVLLGWLIGVEVAMFDRSEWLVAAVILVGMGWSPVLLFWWATRPRVTAEG